MASWQDAPIVYVEAHTCPCCGSADWERKRTETSALKATATREATPGDGSKTWKLECLACGERWKLVFEPPAPIGQFPTGHAPK